MKEDPFRNSIEQKYIEIQYELQKAMQVTNTLVTKDSHIPLPTRLADIMTHEIRRKYV